MLKQFIGKECKAYVAGFGGSFGRIVSGILDSYDDDY